MRAVVYERYGPPEVLRVEDVPRPAAAEDELLVRVRATTVNRTDCGWRSAKPFVVRYFIGVLRPRRSVLGMEFAGEVVRATISPHLAHVYSVERLGPMVSIHTGS